MRDAAKGVFEDIKKLNLRRLADPGDLPPGARDALAAIDAKIDAAALFAKAFPEGGGEMKRLTDVLKRGSSLDLMSRVQAFIAIVQSKDVPVPAPLQNFVQSYVRLCDIVEDLDHTVADLQVAANSIYCDVPKLAPAPGEPKTFTLLKAVASAYVGSAGSQCSPAAIRSAGADFAKWAASNEGKAEIRSLARDPAKIKNELAPLVDVLQGIGIYRKFDADGNVFGVTADEKGGTVRLYGEIPPPSPDRNDALLKAAMEANHFRRGTGGGTFSLNPDTGVLTLADSRPLATLDEETFYAFIERFVNALATWKGLASAAAPSSAQAGERQL